MNESMYAISRLTYLLALPNDKAKVERGKVRKKERNFIQMIFEDVEEKGKRCNQQCCRLYNDCLYLSSNAPIFFNAPARRR
jgi:hypothetical protein